VRRSEGWLRGRDLNPRPLGMSRKLFLVRSCSFILFCDLPLVLLVSCWCLCHLLEGLLESKSRRTRSNSPRFPTHQVASSLSREHTPLVGFLTQRVGAFRPFHVFGRLSCCPSQLKGRGVMATPAAQEKFSPRNFQSRSAASSPAQASQAKSSLDFVRVEKNLASLGFFTPPTRKSRA
jgi:hypothetical protein